MLGLFLICVMVGIPYGVILMAQIRANKMLKNNTGKPINLESGKCLAGATCIATHKEILVLCRQQGIVELVTGDEPKPIQSKKSAKATKAFDEWAKDLGDPEELAQGSEEGFGDWPDGYGPANGSIEWKTLSTTARGKINKRRGPP